MPAARPPMKALRTVISVSGPGVMITKIEMARKVHSDPVMRHSPQRGWRDCLRASLRRFVTLHLFGVARMLLRQRTSDPWALLEVPVVAIDRGPFLEVNRGRDLPVEHSEQIG